MNVFDSLNMFVRTDLPDPLMRSYHRYSLPHNENYPNHSDLMDSRTRRPLNYNSILCFIQPFSTPLGLRAEMCC